MEANHPRQRRAPHALGRSGNVARLRRAGCAGGGRATKTATYEPWDIETGNIVGSFSTRREALQTVAVLLRSYGNDDARHLALGQRDGTASMRIVSTGEALMAAGGRHASDPARGSRVASG